MKNYYKLFLLSILFISCEPKITEINSFEKLNIENFKIYSKSFYWDKNEEQIKYYRSGYLEVDYAEKEGKLIRRTYSESGLETEIEVIQKYGVDTFWQINPVTLDDEQVIKTGIEDIYVGMFTKYKNYWYGYYYWENNDIATQKAYWNNGNLRTEYKFNKEQEIIRQDYDLDGLTLASSTKIKRVYSADTTWQINAVTLEDKMILEIGYVDSFIKQTFQSEPIIILEGQYKENKKHGSWYSYENDIVTEVIYENDILQDNYNEYILTDDLELKIQWKGFFIQKEFVDTTFFESGYNAYTKKIILKNGLWKKYDLKGKFVKQIHFNTDSLLNTIK